MSHIDRTQQTQPADLSDVLSALLMKSYTDLDSLERQLAALGQAPESAELAAGVFRTIDAVQRSGHCLALSDDDVLGQVRVNLVVLMETIHGLLADLTIPGVVNRLDVATAAWRARAALDAFSAAPAAP